MLSIVSQMCKEGCAGKNPYILPVALDGNELSNIWSGHFILWGREHWLPMELGSN
jgi:hypothetical protein